MEGYGVPEDVLHFILLRLPVKSLLRFKCVCKSWYALIKNPNFITHHFSLKNGGFILVSRVDQITKKLAISSLSHTNLDPISSESLYLPPPIDDAKTLEILGPINGFLCVSTAWDVERDILLWNPATRESLILPSLILPRNSRIQQYVVGFGFDFKNFDFKVVKIRNVAENHQLGTTHVEIHSSSMGFWSCRVINPSFSAEIDSPTFNAFVHGACHWWAHRSHTIISFDMGDEVFHNIDLPLELEYLDRSCLGPIMVINESLAALVNDRLGERIYWCLDVWVMEEYGVKESWSRLYTVRPFSAPDRPLGLLKNGSLLMENAFGQLVCHDSNTQKRKVLEVSGVPPTMELVSYVESMFPITGVIF